MLDVLLLEFTPARFVVLTQQIAGFDLNQPDDDNDEQSGETRIKEVALNRYLNIDDPTDDTILRTLVVSTDTHSMAFRTGASLQLMRLEEHNLFRMPELMRVGACAPWICGIALLDREAVVSLGSINKAAIWLDLVALMHAIAAENNNQIDKRGKTPCLDD